MASAASNIGGAAALSAPAGANAGPVLTASAAASGQAAQAAANATMNNGRKDTTHSDVQKLQQQLNDIKEQVRFYIVFQKFPRLSCNLNIYIFFIKKKFTF